MSKCIGCDTPIPAGASKCPMCGANIILNRPKNFGEPLEFEKYSSMTESVAKKGWSWPAKIGAGFLCLMFFSSFFSNSNSTQSHSQPQKEEVPKQDPDLVKALAGAMTLKNSSRNPSSFQLIKANKMSNGSACYTFRSQNGFGGMNIAKAVLIRNGDDIITSEMDGFSDIWNRECANTLGENIVDYLELALK